MPDYCFINGKIIPSEQATIGIYDLGLLRGYAAFDYMRTYNGKPFRIEDHLKRFRNSAAELRLTIKYSNEEIKTILSELLQKSKPGEDAAFRFILTGGYAKDSMTVTEPNFIISIEDLPSYPSGIFETGVKIATYQFQRNLPSSKTIEYMTALKLQDFKKEKNAHDILYCFKDEVLEITRNNFFLVKNNILITPKDNVLHGITRKVIIELAQGNYKVEERKVSVSEIPTADEAFLCGTSKGAVPIIQIDDYKIGDGKPGMVTKKIMELFNNYSSHY